MHLLKQAVKKEAIASLPVLAVFAKGLSQGGILPLLPTLSKGRPTSQVCHQRKQGLRSKLHLHEGVLQVSLGLQKANTGKGAREVKLGSFVEVSTQLVESKSKVSRS